MTNRKQPRKVDNWTFETIQKFVEVASEEDIVAMRENLARQAELMRRHGDSESAAFWEAMVKAIADAAGRPDRRASRGPSKRDAA